MILFLLGAAFVGAGVGASLLKKKPSAADDGAGNPFQTGAGNVGVGVVDRTLPVLGDAPLTPFRRLFPSIVELKLNRPLHDRATGIAIVPEYVTRHQGFRTYQVATGRYIPASTVPTPAPRRAYGGL